MCQDKGSEKEKRQIILRLLRLALVKNPSSEERRTVRTALQKGR
jgi:hypothetical protein